MRCDEVQVKLKTLSETIEINALSFPKICAPLPLKLDVESYPHLDGLEIADASVVTDSSSEIDILIGADHYYNVVKDKVRRGNEGPIVFDTKFGWVLSGPADGFASDGSNHSMTHLVITKEDPLLMESPYQEDENKALTYQLSKFWDVEAIGIQNDDSSPADKEFLREIHYSDEENRYEVNLPWKSGHIPKSNGYVSCINCLRQLHRKLKGDGHLLCEYNNVIKQQTKDGIVERVLDQNEPDEGTYYLPHQGVIRSDKETTKLRVVFDGSAKPDNTNLSINECLETGPNLVPHLFDVIIKFRGYPIAMVADIEKAFIKS